VDASPDGLLFHRLSFLAYHPPDRFREHHLKALRDDRLVGIISLAEEDGEGGRELRSPYGGSFGGWVTAAGLDGDEHEALLEALVVHARELGCTALCLGSLPAPYRTDGEWADFALRRRGARVARQEITHVVPLDGSEEDVRGRLRPKARRSARKAERLGTAVRAGGADDLPAFHDLLVADRARLDATPTHTLAELQDLTRRRPGDLRLFLAENAGRLVGGVLTFCCSPRIGMDFYSVRADVPEAERCVHLLPEHCLVDARARGHAWFDLGTSSLGGEPIPGLCRFKESLGALPFVRATWRLELD